MRASAGIAPAASPGPVVKGRPWGGPGGSGCSRADMVLLMLIRAGNESGAGSAVPRGCGCLVFVSVAGSRRTTLCASLQDLEKQRPEPGRALMARDVSVR